MSKKNLIEIQKEIVEDFEGLFDWKERYQYLIELGSKLPVLSNEQKIETNKVHGCQSQVWLVYHIENDQLVFAADSDSQIVKGILAILLEVFSQQTAQAIVEAPLDFIETIGLSKHLSMSRSNGLAAMLAKIKDIANTTLLETKKQHPHDEQ